MTTLIVVGIVNIVLDVVLINLVFSRTERARLRDRVLFRKFKTIEKAFWLCKTMLDGQEGLLRAQAGPGMSHRTQWDTIPKR